MQKVMVCGEEFQFEKLNEEVFKYGAAAFRVIDKNGDVSFWVNTPVNMDDAVNNGVSTLNDGRVVAFCRAENDAVLIASAINIASTVANVANDMYNSLNEEYEKLAAEFKRLKADGKTTKEILKILMPRMDELFTADGKARRRMMSEDGEC